MVLLLKSQNNSESWFFSILWILGLKAGCHSQNKQRYLLSHLTDPWTCNSNPTIHICFDRDKFLLTNTISHWCDQFWDISQKTYINLSCRKMRGIIVYAIQLWISQEKWKWWYLDASPVSSVRLVIELNLSASNWPQMWMSVSWELWGTVTWRYVL